jgi:hypothetical protein
MALKASGLGQGTTLPEKRISGLPMNVAGHSSKRPSWLRWPPNCCETCTGWIKTDDWVGRCEQPASLNRAEITDARFRCQDFKRKQKEG